MNNKKKYKKGYSLTEVLVSVAILSIISGVSVSAINPQKQLGKVRNIQRWNDISTLQKSLDRYYMVNQQYPAELENQIGEYKEICDTGNSSFENNQVDCSGKINLSFLVPEFLPEVLKDPFGENYKIGINPENSQSSIWADKAFFEEKIVINEIKIVEPGTTIWAKSTINSGHFPKKIVSDEEGNVYVVGTFNANNIDFGGGISLSRMGWEEIFIAKYDSLGDIKWARRLGGIDNDNGNGIALDSDGGVYVTGSFRNTMSFDGTSNSLIANGSDVFVARYNTEGAFQWARRAGSVGTDIGHNITIDINNNIYIVGEYNGFLSFDGTGTTLSGYGSSDVFFMKYNKNGDFILANRAGGSSPDRGYGIAVDSDQNFYITGEYFSSSMNFPGSANLTNSGMSDGFIAKYDSSANIVWRKRMSGSSFQKGASIKISPDNNIYVIGDYNGLITFDTGKTLTGINTEGFIVKYNQDANTEWFTGTNGNLGESISDLSFDQENNFYITGYFSSNALGFFGSSLTFNKINGDDIFLVKYNNLGSLEWGRIFGGISSDKGNGLAIDNEGYIYLSGVFQSDEINLGKDKDDVDTRLSNPIPSSNDLFIAKYKK